MTKSDLPEPGQPSSPVVEVCGCGQIIGRRVEVQTRYGKRLWLQLSGSTMPLETARGRCPGCGRDWVYYAWEGSFADWVQRQARAKRARGALKD